MIFDNNAGVTVAANMALLEASSLFSEDLGIDLAGGSEEACFRWFLASMLFGARITTTIATHTYQAFERHGLVTPKAILQAGVSLLVNPVMGEGGYVHYDASKSRRLLQVCRQMIEDYGGRVTAVHEVAANSHDLEGRVRRFPGVGPVTTNIFLRELRPFWAKADPKPLPVVIRTASANGVTLPADRKTLAYVRLEAGLIRLAQASPVELRRA